MGADERSDKSKGGQADKKPPVTFGRWGKENLDAIAVAFIVALIIRCFCIEVFKIPSNSMRPTLFGDPKTGDKIIVNKLYYHFYPVERFDVVVFKYPLDTSKNYVKRAVGVPNEDFMVLGGDIYTRKGEPDRFQVARKSWKIQESIWLPFYEADLTDDKAWRGKWITPPSPAWKVEGGKLAVHADPNNWKECQFTFSDEIVDDTHKAVPDVRFGLAFTLTAASGGVCASIATSEGRFAVKLFADEDGVFEDSSEDGVLVSSKPLAARLVQGQEHTLVLAAYDGCAQVALDGEELLRYEYRAPLAAPPGPRPVSPEIRFAVMRGGAEFAKLDIRRDIYYLGRDSIPEGMPSEGYVHIPEDCYVVMGDNSPTSKDSRMWRMRTIVFTDGRVLQGDADAYSEKDDYGRSMEPGYFKFRDIYGVEYSRLEKDCVKMQVDKPCMFVNRRDIIGKAFLVCWPPKRAKLVK
jgi:signal peptidase I